MGRPCRPLLPAAPLAEPQCGRLAERDWRDSYKAHFQAWHFGRLHWVPLWERAAFALPAGHAVLWLDPGLAFGTGNHETTRLCCERLVDAGGGRRPTGPGSSTPAAARASSRSPRACWDAGRSRPSTTIPRRCGSAARTPPEWLGRSRAVFGRRPGERARRPSADLVLANIQADVLVRHMRELVRAVAPGGKLVLSGILAAEGRAVEAALVAAAPGWSSDSRALGEWCDVVLRRPRD